MSIDAEKEAVERNVRRAVGVARTLMDKSAYNNNAGLLAIAIFWQFEMLDGRPTPRVIG